MTTIFFWVLSALAMLLAELFVPGLFFALSFSFGAGAAAVATALGGDLGVQLGACAATTLLALSILRFLVKKTARCTGIKTNTDRLLGARARVTKEIDGQIQPGLVKTSGQVWAAYAHDFGAIPVGREVEVVGIRGCHLIVKELL